MAKSTRGQFVIVEDSVHIRNILRIFLKVNGFEVLEFSNGAEAFKGLSENNYENIWGAFVDIMMPKMDGLELADELSKDQKLCKIPLFFITASTTKDNIIRAKAVGARSYLVKPISTVKIIKALKKAFPNEKFKEINLGS